MRCGFKEKEIGCARWFTGIAFRPMTFRSRIPLLNYHFFFSIEKGKGVYLYTPNPIVKRPLMICRTHYYIKCRLLPSDMAKGKSDVILRDRLQFDVNAGGSTSLVYGRVDLSDYVNIVKKDGLAIKEIRYQVRDPSSATGVFNQALLVLGGGANDQEAYLKVFATTTAYEDVADVGIGSPNVISILEFQSTFDSVPTPTAEHFYQENTHNEFGTPDLHPDGYDVVTDILIGVSASNMERHQSKTLELDVMIIAEPKNITQKDLTQMLTQAQDL